MPRSTKRSSLAAIVVAAALAAPTLVASPDTARADVTVQVRGKVKVRVGDRKAKRVRVRHRPPRTAGPHVRLRIGGGVHWHGHVHVGGYAEPPPPPPDYDCDAGPVPSYYTEPPPPPPVHYDPEPVVVHAAAPRQPRLGVGVFAGSIQLADRMTGDDMGLFGRLRLTNSLSLEAELAKSEMQDLRVDRRAGGSLLYDFSPQSRWSAHVLAGAGMTHVDVQDGTWQSKQEYGELGAGLSLRLTPRLEISGDIRAGARSRVDDAPVDQALKNVAPSSEQEEKYTRGRVSAVLYF